MISLEMARKLKNAGMEWEPKAGEWFIFLTDDGKAGEPELWSVEHQEEYDEDIRGNRENEEVFWLRYIRLPRLDQLLAEVANRLWKWIISQESCEIWPVGLSRHSNCIVFEADTPDDAAAEALLWILQRKEV